MIEAVRKVPGGGRRKAETRKLGARCSVRAETRAIDYLSYYISSFLGPSLSHAVSHSPAGFGHPSLDSSRVTGGQSGDRRRRRFSSLSFEMLLLALIFLWGLIQRNSPLSTLVGCSWLLSAFRDLRCVPVPVPPFLYAFWFCFLIYLFV